MSLTRYFQEFKPGEKVTLKAEPSIQKGVYFRRFHGMVATVSKKLGSCYELLLNDKGKEKRLIVHPVHLQVKK